ncbi:acyl-CoA dehydrogenase family protein [Amorphus orientalis]|uniref:Alkylation response protein AidB-like acyl-CoA dehydrogenase n=1 Tax=Amorphus orientalis TaxID=649198 RepID=A0AAE3VRY7_9HYPH|nr:acyl-CoA dehydrogenase family protein [Amorphus orientalis]MDQ0317282.1 alkylation response protein AidB-like acyl-CoA dehydrogenase [Amorphus orientalis]
MSVFESDRDQPARVAAELSATPGWRRLTELDPDLDDETAATIIAEAAKIADAVVAPLNPVADREGCRLENGRVRTPAGYRGAYKAIAEAGFLGVEIAPEVGGQGLPVTLQAACGPFFEGACPAFMMLAGASRAAAHLMMSVADETIRDAWVPRLLSGEWGATICISEPDAGSDVGRIRTRAEQADGIWRVTGQKIWISFGDHDVTDRIGHCLLARTGDEPGTRGLSLFLVPSIRDDGTANAVTVSRIEEKLGLHGSPTCALGFDGAEAVLLGREGRGLPALFAMIEQMRLLTGCEGLGIAARAADVAFAYAVDRRQGGDPEEAPLPIVRHADVRRQLLALDAQTEILRAAILELAVSMDLARREEGAAAEDNAAFVAWLLPMVKTFGAETGFDVASGAIQVLGGAGYTREWPVEQALRDSRVLAIYEGTSGIQALDFLTRRLWREKGRGLADFLDRAKAAIEAARPLDADLAGTAERVVSRFERLSSVMMEREDVPRDGEAGASGYMRAGWCAISAVMAVRLLIAGTETPSQSALKAVARFRLHTLEGEMGLAEAQASMTAELMEAI